MSLVSWLAGWGVLLLQTVALLSAARGARRWLVPLWTGAAALLATGVLAVALTVLIAQLVGLVGLFHWAALLVGAVVAAVLLRPQPLVPAWLSATTASDSLARVARAAFAPTDRWGRVQRISVAVGLTLLATNWLAHVVGVYHYGSSDGDSMMYHLPFATRFVQSGLVTEVPHIGPHPWVAFYPANVELVQATIMAPLGHTAVVPLLSLAWLALGLLAGWCIGARAGHGPLGLLVAAVIFSVSVLTATHAGTGRVDVAAAALLLAAVALLVQEPRNLGAVAVAGLALGLAMGAKFVILPTAGLLVILAGLVLWRRDGWRSTGLWVGSAAVPTSLWLVRNWVVAGSPLPMIDLRLGPVGFAQLDDERMATLEDTSIVDQLQLQDGYWDEVLVPAFASVFDSLPVAGVLLGAAVGAVALVLVRLRPVGLAHAAALAALAGSVGFFFSPNSSPTAWGVDGMAMTIVALNTRYLMPSLLILVCLLALGLDEKWRRAGAALCAAAAVLVAVFTWQNLVTMKWGEWPVGWTDITLALGLIAGVGALTAVAALSAVRGALSRPVLVASAAGLVTLAVLALTGGTWWAADREVLNQYAASPPSQRELWHAVHAEGPGQTVGVLGEWLQQPFSRDDLANEVQYLGLPVDQGRYLPPETCPHLAESLADDDYNLVVAMQGLFDHGNLQQHETWLADAPGTEVVVENDMGMVVRLPSDFSLSCS